MIMKAQLALGGYGAGKRVLLYNEDRRVMFQTQDPEIVKRMNHRAKVFFHAHVTFSEKEGYVIELEAEAPDQDW